MEKLPIVLLRMIDDYLNIYDHLAFTSVSKSFQRLKKNYHKYLQDYKRGKYIPNDVRFSKYLVERYNVSCLSMICEGSLECAKVFMKVKFDRNAGLFHACCVGNMDIIHLMIQHGANNFDGELVRACRSGNLEIVHLMIQKGAKKWNEGLVAACENGDYRIILLLIDKGANDWNGGLVGACRGGHMFAALLMLYHGAKFLNSGLGEACENGHIEIAQLMIDRGANDLGGGLFQACRKNHQKLIHLLIHKGAKRCNFCDRDAVDHL